MPPVVLICSPQGAQDLLSRTDSRAERGETSVSHELSAVIGDNLLTMSHAEWLPRRRAIQPLFATRNVPQFAGHVAALAQEFAERWLAGAGEIDLDRECRALTLRALGLSILGVDLQGRDDTVASVLRDAVSWAVGRAMRPVNTPRWWPTRAGSAPLRPAPVCIGSLLTFCELAATAQTLMHRWCEICWRHGSRHGFTVIRPRYLRRARVVYRRGP